MNREHDEALAEFLAAFDERLETAPLVDRRGQGDRRGDSRTDGAVDGRRSGGPVADAFAYWVSATGRPD